MNSEILKRRTQNNAVAIIKLVDKLPNKAAGWEISKQLIRCANSVAANYRAACRAKSKADFIAKLGIVEEEADEVCYWIDVINQAELVPKGLFDEVEKEAKEFVAIFTASRKTAKSNSQ